VLGFNFSVVGSSFGSAGSGAGAGKATIQPINVLKDIDSGTPLLMQALVTGEVLEAVTLTVQEPANSEFPCLSLT
jgi:type VI protein secretion system component Hcp